MAWYVCILVGAGTPSHNQVSLYPHRESIEEPPRLLAQLPGARQGTRRKTEEPLMVSVPETSCLTSSSQRSCL